MDITSFDSSKNYERIGEYVIKEAKSGKGMGTGERTSHNGESFLALLYISCNSTFSRDQTG